MECSVLDCHRPHRARELCDPHYKRWLRHREVHPDVPIGHMPRVLPAGLRPQGANPWINVAPPCPHCASPEWVVRYWQDDDLWRCVECHKDFRP